MAALPVVLISSYEPPETSPVPEHQTALAYWHEVRGERDFPA